jgi:chemotaxis methyl-accepting protein methylase
VRTVLAQAGLDADAYRARPLQRRLGACLRAVGAVSATEALEALATDPRLHGLALDALLNATTSLFRDRDVFVFLRAAVVPALAGRPRPRVLSVGCSSGAELASVAMLLDEAGALEASDLLGIDCRPAALAAARRGVYTPREAASIPPRQRSRYLAATPEGYALAPEILNRLSFHLASATHAPPRGPWDLILCRNVAIYLSADAAGAQWRRLAHALTAPSSVAQANLLGPPPPARAAREDRAGDWGGEGGFLVVGHAERVPPECGLTRCGPSAYRRDRLPARADLEGL